MPRKTKWTGVKWTSKKRPQQRRVRIGQPAYRPLKVQRVQPDKLREKPADLVIHRRGPRRTKIGLDYQETRAQQGIKGTLPERIVYKALVKRGYKPGVDFDFQSSQLGGRMMLGGILADFLFPYKRIVIQVQGPTHSSFVRAIKDQEQRELLKTLGYTTLEIGQDIILSEARLQEWLRRNVDITFFASVESVEAVSASSKYAQEETNA